ncbi:hypothetical protein LRS03_00435 [Rhizobacter sp. J219]|uniref:hypothetical protein n=1 Tax=Rhizobacter sp. J219 TaxID=2898430 RepID=UPI00215170B2|nr:hypothetical protein [Rhizobacter sp. J219]MCR5881410.1 hypothetical protein [Rhizobacter sp. J219]
MREFFNTYPVLASLLVMVLSLVVGAIELGAMKSRAPAILTWVFGGLALTAPIGSSALASGIKLVLIAAFLAAYGLGVAFVWKSN